MKLPTINSANFKPYSDIYNEEYDKYQKAKAGQLPNAYVLTIIVQGLMPVAAVVEATITVANKILFPESSYCRLLSGNISTFDHKIVECVALIPGSYIAYFGVQFLSLHAHTAYRYFTESAEDQK